MTLQKNQVIVLTIAGLSAEGNGVGRYTEAAGTEDAGEAGGLVVFVPLTAVGDTVRCRVEKVQKTHAYGRMVELLTASPDRLPEGVDCAAFGRCGGCAFRHVRYEAELRYKWQRVADTLTRLAGLSLSPEPIVGAEDPGRYRNKAQYPVAQGADRLITGLYAARSHRVTEQRDCALQPAVFREAVDAVMAWAAEAGVTAYDEATGRGLLRHIYLRQAAVTGQLMLCLVCTAGKLPQTDRLLERVRAVPGLVSVAVNLNRERTNVILGAHTVVLWGADALEDELCGLRFRLSPRSFYQVNPAQAQRLYRLVAEAAALTGGETVLDLYCGTGTIGLSMARQAGQVIGVETEAAAVADARRNAADNGLTNTRFLCADAGEAARQLAAEGVRPDVTVLDPPRKGCAPTVIDTVTALASRRVVYVSCDPATLARDLRQFAACGYGTVRVTPVDMFPRTPHVECVALLER